MLDTITYSQNKDGSLSLVITHYEVDLDLSKEYLSVMSQLSSFKAAEQTDEIAAAIVNYASQLDYLVGLFQKDKPLPTLPSLI